MRRAEVLQKKSCQSELLHEKAVDPAVKALLEV